MNDDIFLEWFGRIETFDNSIGSRVLDCRAAELDCFLEHADDKITIEQIFTGLWVHQCQVVVIAVGSLIAALANVQRRATGRYSRDGIVAVLSAVVAAIENDARRVVTATNSAKI